MAWKSPLPLGSGKINDMYRGAGAVTAPAEGRSVFATRITSLHMELVSCTRSLNPFSSLPRDELFVQGPDSSALSNAVSSDPPPASSKPHRLNLFKTLLPKWIFTHFISLLSLGCYTPTPGSFNLLRPEKMSPPFSQRTEMKFKSWKSWGKR